MGFLQAVVNDSLLAEAREIDQFAAQHIGRDLPSLEATLRLVRDIDPEHFRRVGRDVWGSGGSGGADEVGHAIDRCAVGLDAAAVQASAWTGSASNAYAQRIAVIKQALSDLRRPAHDVGQALIDLADGFEHKVQDMWNNVWSLIGFIVGIISLIAGIIVGLTGVGAILGLILGVIGVLVGIAAWWHSQKIKADEQVAKCEAAAAVCVRTIEGLGH